jgi:AcrR family transcriptional regulator
MALSTTTVRGHARKAILDAADGLFYRDGIRATSVDAVADEAGVTKRTLYHHFESKDDLIAAYLERRDEPTRVALAAKATAVADAPAARVLAVFDVLARFFATSDCRGCAFLNAASECASDSRVRRAAIAHKDATEAWFREQLTAAGSREPAAYAAMLMLLLDGALARSLLYPDGPPVRAARDAAAIILREAGIAIPRTA